MVCSEEVHMKRISVLYTTKQRFGTIRMQTNVPFLIVGIWRENPFSLFMFI
jgi:lysozyme family protein